MKHHAGIRRLLLGAALVIATIMAAGTPRAPIASVAGDRPPADALASPSRHLPSPFLAASGLALELPAAELGLRGPQPGQTLRSADPVTTGTRSISTLASRIPVIQIRHEAFAARDHAARAGLLSYRTTAPPPPLG
jgi:hypothetical protein